MANDELISEDDIVSLDRLHAEAAQGSTEAWQTFRLRCYALWPSISKVLKEVNDTAHPTSEASK